MADEAIDMVDRLRPDAIVLMDLSMPHMNGVKAIERLAGSHPYVKTILLTGLEDSQHLLAARPPPHEFLLPKIARRSIPGSYYFAQLIPRALTQSNGKAPLMGRVAAMERLSTRAKSSLKMKRLCSSVLCNNRSYNSADCNNDIGRAR